MDERAMRSQGSNAVVILVAATFFPFARLEWLLKWNFLEMKILEVYRQDSGRCCSAQKFFM